MKLKHKDVLGLQDMDASEIRLILDQASRLKEILSRPIKKVPTLRGKSVCTLFFEPSTRTRTSFEMAAKILSADISSVAVAASSVVKGESLKDTLLTLRAIGHDLFIIRHQCSGAPEFAAKYLDVPVINAGDGMHEHPTQALLDMLTIQENKRSFEDLVVTIVGDVSHSRVARSNLFGLSKLGAKVRFVGPPTLMPYEIERTGVQVFTGLDEALEGADVVNVLRIQLERQKSGLFPSTREYAQLYGINRERLQRANPGVLVLHPGPMNRGIEIEPDVADDEKCCMVTRQVTNGVAIRMALLYLLLGGSDQSDATA